MDQRAPTIVLAMGPKRRRARGPLTWRPPPQCISRSRRGSPPVLGRSSCSAIGHSQSGIVSVSNPVARVRPVDSTVRSFPCRRSWPLPASHSTTGSPCSISICPRCSPRFRRAASPDGTLPWGGCRLRNAQRSGSSKSCQSPTNLCFAHDRSKSNSSMRRGGRSQRRTGRFVVRRISNARCTAEIPPPMRS